jgi:hypothetical protein
MSIFTTHSHKTDLPAGLHLEPLEDRTVPAVLDLTTQGASGTIGAASFLQANPQPTGVGVIHDFLRIQSSATGEEQGYNSDARPVQLDEKSDTRAIHLSELPTVNIGGQTYRVALLGINQRQNGSNGLISQDELRIYTADSSTVSGYDPTTQQLGGLTAVYDMGANYVKLNSALSHGNGSGDMFLFVPDSLLASPTGNPDPYVYFYSKFGVNCAAKGGFEQWAPGVGVTLPAPASLSGFVYADANQSGTLSAGDSGLAGVSLTLTGTNFLGQAITMTTTTAPNGSYIFTGLLLGSYTISGTPPGGYLPESAAVGSVNGVTDGTMSAPNVITNIKLKAGQAGINYDFGDILAPPPVNSTLSPAPGSTGPIGDSSGGVNPYPIPMT